MHQNPCFILFILHNNSFDIQVNEINKNEIYLLFSILSCKNFLLLPREQRADLESQSKR